MVYTDKLEEMYPTRLAYEPTNLTPCFVLRSRRETNTMDSANSRLTNHWQTDDAEVKIKKTDDSGYKRYMDMNPTPSRLYREDLKQAQPFVIPSSKSEQVKMTTELNTKIRNTLSTIEGIDNSGTGKNLQVVRNEQMDLYKLLLEQQKYITTDSLSQNPYFAKYDVASDSRNIVRELRAAVSEDITDRGIRESHKLLQRELDSRWIPEGYAAEKGIDSLAAFELMRPKMNNMDRRYH